MSLISSIQTEKDLKKWLEERAPKEVVDQLLNKSEEEKLGLDKAYVQLSKEVKRLFGKPFDDPEVQKLIMDYMKATMEFVGEEAIQAFQQMDVQESEQLVEQYPSPFTPEEEAWLNQAMEYCMTHHHFMSTEDGERK
jgi:hypothetical protein